MRQQVRKNAQTYPALSSTDLNRVQSLGTLSSPLQDTVLVQQGEPMERFLVVLEGKLAVELTSRSGTELITIHEPGEFFGDVYSLSGRPSLVSGRMLTDGKIVTITRSDLQSLMQNDSKLGELFMRAFILRRLELLANTEGNAIVLGSLNSTGTLRLREFLTRNGYPYAFVDLEKDKDVQDLLDQFEICLADIPVLIHGNERVLRNPSNEKIADALGLNLSVNLDDVRDVTIVGAGPAGLSAAVYAASEGLSALLLESKAPGGQAGSSSRIENYLGFPNGISGLDLAGRALDQAQKFGAELLIARSALELTCAARPVELQTSGGVPVRSRAVVIATGAQYRKLPLDNLEQFEGVGIYYGAATIEAQMCSEVDVIVVGGGNSAGQAAIFLSTWAEHVHVLIRSGTLASSMSRYLIRRIEETPNITLHPHTEITALRGDKHLEGVTWLNNQTGVSEDFPIRHVYLMTGASPNTTWLRGCVALDDKGFVLTGADLTPDLLEQSSWPLARKPYLLETSIPGVFAAGDVRSGSVKRVASGVGEGSLAISFVHKVLSE